MPFTREQIADIKSLFKECFNDLLASEDFLKPVCEKVSKNIEGHIDHVLKRYVDDIDDIKNKNAMLIETVDELEQYSRRYNVRVFGLQETKGEVVLDKVLDVFNNNMKICITEENIDRCHRIGRPGSTPRSIIVKFKSYKYKETIMKNKKNLKGTKVIITEDLTKRRYEVLKQAQQKLGRKNCWSRDGALYVKKKNQIVKVKTQEDINNI